MVTQHEGPLQETLKETCLDKMGASPLYAEEILLYQAKCLATQVTPSDFDSNRLQQGGYIQGLFGLGEFLSAVFQQVPSTPQLTYSHPVTGQEPMPFEKVLRLSLFKGEKVG